MASKIVNKITQGTISFVGENVMPVMKNSKFRETGMITPDEFVAAGDYLVYHCPTWHWEGGEVSRRKAYLPPEKQFLVTKQVPSYRRCHQISVLPENEKVIKLDQNDDEAEGWVDTHHGLTAEQLQEEVTDLTIEDKPPSTTEQQQATPLVGVVVEDSDSDDDGPVVDMDEYDEEDDPAAVPVSKTTVKKQDAAVGGGDILKTRTYDLNITYDNYYRTPRLWLFGYNEKGQPLTEDEMYEDISQDHLNKTVTMENHPHLPPPPRASVHPCRHAELMKKITTMMEESGAEMEVHSYLLVFLKFVQAVIPTIEYDFTQQLSLASS